MTIDRLSFNLLKKYWKVLRGPQAYRAAIDLCMHAGVCWVREKRMTFFYNTAVDISKKQILFAMMKHSLQCR